MVCDLCHVFCFADVAVNNNDPFISGLIDFISMQPIAVFIFHPDILCITRHHFIIGILRCLCCFGILLFISEYNAFITMCVNRQCIEIITGKSKTAQYQNQQTDTNSDYYLCSLFHIITPFTFIIKLCYYSRHYLKCKQMKNELNMNRYETP